IQHAAHVRPHLDAVADLAEFRCLLQHANAPALLGEGERRRQPADTAADTQERQVTHKSKTRLPVDKRRYTQMKSPTLNATLTRSEDEAFRLPQECRLFFYFIRVYLRLSAA